MVHPSSAAAASKLAADDPHAYRREQRQPDDRDAPRSTTNANTSDSVSVVHAPSTSSVSVSVSVQVGGGVWNLRQPGWRSGQLLSNQPSQNSCSATSSAVDDDTLDVFENGGDGQRSRRVPRSNPPDVRRDVREGRPPPSGRGGSSGSVRSEPPDAPSFDSPRPYRPQRGAVPRGRHGGPEPPPDAARAHLRRPRRSKPPSLILEPAGGGFRAAQVATERASRPAPPRTSRRTTGRTPARRLSPWSDVVGFSNLDPSRRAVSSRARAPRGSSGPMLGAMVHRHPPGRAPRGRSSPHTNVTRTASADREPEQRTRLRKDVEVVPSGKMLNPAEDDLAGGWIPSRRTPKTRAPPPRAPPRAIDTTRQSRRARARPPRRVPRTRASSRASTRRALRPGIGTPTTRRRRLQG